MQTPQLLNDAISLLLLLAPSAAFVSLVLAAARSNISHAVSAKPQLVRVFAEGHSRSYSSHNLPCTAHNSRSSRNPTAILLGP